MMWLTYWWRLGGSHGEEVITFGHDIMMLEALKDVGTLDEEHEPFAHVNGVIDKKRWAIKEGLETPMWYKGFA